MQTPAYVHNPTLHDTVDALEESICHHVRYSLAKAWPSLSKRDLFVAVALAVRDRMVDKMFETAARYRKADAKRLYYLSMEFLIGRLLGTNLQNLGLLEVCQEALLRMGVDLEELRESESDPALGNGGLGPAGTGVFQQWAKAFAVEPRRRMDVAQVRQRSMEIDEFDWPAARLARACAVRQCDDQRHARRHLEQ